MGTKKYFIRLISILGLLFCSVTNVFSQLDGKKNTVKINLTNPMIFGGKAIIFGYERVIGKNRSIGIDIGRTSLPGFGSRLAGDSVRLKNNTNEKGFHISADYRFYLGKENKFEAPRGVYIGPYYSFNHFSRDNEWDLATAGFTGSVKTNLALNINTIGAELGYQFVLWKKLAIDLVLAGPGMGFYSLKTTLGTSLSAEDKELFFDRLNEYLQEKIPGYSLVTDEGEYKRNGSANTTALGFRYMINIGFRF